MQIKDAVETYFRRDFHRVYSHHNLDHNRGVHRFDDSIQQKSHGKNRVGEIYASLHMCENVPDSGTRGRCAKKDKRMPRERVRRNKDPPG